MGVLAALGVALAWAIAAAVISHHVKRIDPVSIAALRMVFAALFSVAALYALNSQGDLASMSFNNMWQLAAAGMLAIVIGDPLYVVATKILGLMRAFTTIIGLFSLLAFVLPAVLLGDPVTVTDGAGAVLIIAGVYVVALYGRPRADAVAGETGETRTLGARQPHEAWAVAPALFLGSVRPAGGGRAMPSVFLGASRSAPPPSRGPEEGERRPIAGGSNAQATEGRAMLRIPGIGLSLPRVMVGIAIALTTALAWAGDTTWLRSASEGHEAASVAMLHIPPGAILLSLYVTARPTSAIRRRTLTLRAVVVIGMTGVFSTGVGTLLFVFAVQDIGGGPASVLFATAPLFALPIAVLVLRERITVWAVVGTVIAVGGIVLLAS